MADRPIWRGHLRLALVSCPIALHTARRESGNLHFHYINPETGNRVRMVTQDAETGEELSRRDLVKGYEFTKDRYVLLDNEDFERTRIESSTVMNIDKFVPAESIDPIYYESAYYVVPDGEAGRDVYAVLRAAIAESGRVALSRVVIARREHAVALMPMENGMVLHTLHEQRDIYDARHLFEPVAGIKPDRDMVQLAMQLIDRQSATFQPTDMEDRYEARLREVIEAKLKGEGIAPAQPEEPERGKVIDLMAALKRSLGQTPPETRPQARPAASRGGRTAAKRSAAKPSSTSRPARKRA